MTARLARLADIAYRRRKLMVLGWIAVLIVIFPVSNALKGKFHADYATPGSDSKTASALIAQRFGGFSGSTVDVVWRADGGANSPTTNQRIDSFLAQASRLSGVGRPGRTRLSPDGKIGATSLELTKQPWDVPKQTGKDLIALANKTSGNGLEVKLGGGPIQDAEGGTGPQGVGFLGAAIVLLIAFGSIVAVGLPLAVALFGLGVSSALIGILAAIIDVPDWATAISSLMLIGVGIDYALLVLTRFRSALDDGKDTHDAVIEAVTTAGRSVLIAGSTVIIAMLGLFLVGLSYMHGVALAASISVLTVMVGAITLLPASTELRRPPSQQPADSGPRPSARAEHRRRLAGASLEPPRAAPSLEIRDRRHGRAAGSRRARAGHAPRVCRCRKRPAREDDPPGLRSDYTRVWPWAQRSAPDRRQAARRRRRDEARPAGQRRAQRPRRGPRHAAASQPGR